MSHQPSTDEHLVGEVRFKVPLPVVIPAVALVVIALVAIGISRVLLSLPKEAAVIVAIAIAANVLGACAFMALRSRVRATSFFELGAIVLYPVLIGIAIAQVGIGEETEHGAAPHGEEQPAPGGGGLTVTAANIAFDTDTLELTAGEPTSLDFVNEDSVEHNISIYPTQEDGTAFENFLFEGEIIPGGDSITYEIPALKKGESYFQCDVHPNMNGTVTTK